MVGESRKPSSLNSTPLLTGTADSFDFSIELLVQSKISATALCGNDHKK